MKKSNVPINNISGVDIDRQLVQRLSLCDDCINICCPEKYRNNDKYKIISMESCSNYIEK